MLKTRQEVIKEAFSNLYKNVITEAFDKETKRNINDAKLHDIYNLYYDEEKIQPNVEVDAYDRYLNLKSILDFYKKEISLEADVSRDLPQQQFVQDFLVKIDPRIGALAKGDVSILKDINNLFKEELDIAEEAKSILKSISRKGPSDGRDLERTIKQDEIGKLKAISWKLEKAKQTLNSKVSKNNFYVQLKNKTPDEDVILYNETKVLDTILGKQSVSFGNNINFNEFFNLFSDATKNIDKMRNSEDELSSIDYKLDVLGISGTDFDRLLVLVNEILSIAHGIRSRLLTCINILMKKNMNVLTSIHDKYKGTSKEQSGVQGLETKILNYISVKLSVDNFNDLIESTGPVYIDCITFDSTLKQIMKTPSSKDDDQETKNRNEEIRKSVTNDRWIIDVLFENLKSKVIQFIKTKVSDQEYNDAVLGVKKRNEQQEYVAVVTQFREMNAEKLTSFFSAFAKDPNKKEQASFRKLYQLFFDINSDIYKNFDKEMSDYMDTIIENSENIENLLNSFSNKLRQKVKGKTAIDLMQIQRYKLKSKYEKETNLKEILSSIDEPFAEIDEFIKLLEPKTGKQGTFHAALFFYELAKMYIGEKGRNPSFNLDLSVKEDAQDAPTKEKNDQNKKKRSFIAEKILDSTWGQAYKSYVLDSLGKTQTYEILRKNTNTGDISVLRAIQDFMIGDPEAADDTLSKSKAELIKYVEMANKRNINLDRLLFEDAFELKKSQADSISKGVSDQASQQMFREKIAESLIRAKKLFRPVLTSYMLDRYQDKTLIESQLLLYNLITIFEESFEAYTTALLGGRRPEPEKINISGIPSFQEYEKIVGSEQTGFLSYLISRFEKFRLTQGQTYYSPVTTEKRTEAEKEEADIVSASRKLYAIPLSDRELSEIMKSLLDLVDIKAIDGTNIVERVKRDPKTGQVKEIYGISTARNKQFHAFIKDSIMKAEDPRAFEMLGKRLIPPLYVLRDKLFTKFEETRVAFQKYYRYSDVEFRQNVDQKVLKSVENNYVNQLIEYISQLSNFMKMFGYDKFHFIDGFNERYGNNIVYNFVDKKPTAQQVEIILGMIYDKNLDGLLELLQYGEKVNARKKAKEKGVPEKEIEDFDRNIKKQSGRAIANLKSMSDEVGYKGSTQEVARTAALEMPVIVQTVVNYLTEYAKDSIDKFKEAIKQHIDLSKVKKPYSLVYKKDMVGAVASNVIDYLQESLMSAFLDRIVAVRTALYAYTPEKQHPLSFLGYKSPWSFGKGGAPVLDPNVQLRNQVDVTNARMQKRFGGLEFSSERFAQSKEASEERKQRAYLAGFTAIRRFLYNVQQGNQSLTEINRVLGNQIHSQIQSEFTRKASKQYFLETDFSNSELERIHNEIKSEKKELGKQIKQKLYNPDSSVWFMEDDVLRNQAISLVEKKFRRKVANQLKATEGQIETEMPAGLPTAGTGGGALVTKGAPTYKINIDDLAPEERAKISREQEEQGFIEVPAQRMSSVKLVPGAKPEAKPLPSEQPIQKMGKDVEEFSRRTPWTRTPLRGAEGETLSKSEKQLYIDRIVEKKVKMWTEVYPQYLEVFSVMKELITTKPLTKSYEDNEDTLDEIFSSHERADDNETLKFTIDKLQEVLSQNMFKDITYDIDKSYISTSMDDVQSKIDKNEKLVSYLDSEINYLAHLMDSKKVGIIKKDGRRIPSKDPVFRPREDEIPSEEPVFRPREDEKTKFYNLYRQRYKDRKASTQTNWFTKENGEQYSLDDIIKLANSEPSLAIDFLQYGGEGKGIDGQLLKQMIVTERMEIIGEVLNTDKYEVARDYIKSFRRSIEQQKKQLSDFKQLISNEVIKRLQNKLKLFEMSVKTADKDSDRTYIQDTTNKLLKELRSEINQDPSSSLDALQSVLVKLPTENPTMAKVMADKIFASYFQYAYIRETILQSAVRYYLKIQEGPDYQPITKDNIVERCSEYLPMLTHIPCYEFPSSIVDATQILKSEGEIEQLKDQKNVDLENETNLNEATAEYFYKIISPILNEYMPKFLKKEKFREEYYPLWTQISNYVVGQTDISEGKEFQSAGIKKSSETQSDIAGSSAMVGTTKQESSIIGKVDKQIMRSLGFVNVYKTLKDSLRQLKDSFRDSGMSGDISPQDFNESFVQVASLARRHAQFYERLNQLKQIYKQFEKLSDAVSQPGVTSATINTLNQKMEKLGLKLDSLNSKNEKSASGVISGFKNLQKNLRIITRFLTTLTAGMHPDIYNRIGPPTKVFSSYSFILDLTKNGGKIEQISSAYSPGKKQTSNGVLESNVSKSKSTHELIFEIIKEVLIDNNEFNILENSTAGFASKIYDQYFEISDTQVEEPETEEVTLSQVLRALWKVDLEREAKLNQAQMKDKLIQDFLNIKTDYTNQFAGLGVSQERTVEKLKELSNKISKQYKTTDDYFDSIGQSKVRPLLSRSFKSLSAISEELSKADNQKALKDIESKLMKIIDSLNDIIRRYFKPSVNESISDDARNFMMDNSILSKIFKILSNPVPIVGHKIPIKHVPDHHLLILKLAPLPYKEFDKYKIYPGNHTMKNYYALEYNGQDKFVENISYIWVIPKSMSSVF